MNYFSELTKQVHLIDDLILSDMRCENIDSQAEEALGFSRHLISTKHWFSRISWSNKKRYLLALLEDVRSAWTLSMLLKSMWNCRPKDAVLSANESSVWSSYDHVALDHNRTAQPVHVLAQVMKNDRAWFLQLDPEPQAIVLSELSRIAGGPVMWEVLRRAQDIYEKCRDEQLRNMQECIVVNEPILDKSEKYATVDKTKKEPSTPQSKHHSASSAEGSKRSPEPGQAMKELEAKLAAWNATIKSLRDSMKLEELEMTFKDGTKRKIWKVNRPKPEAIETVDFVQLLPAAVGKRILSYLPRAQLTDYAKVNKYWAYLVEDLKAELAARLKINTELRKLEELILRHDTDMEAIAQIGLPGAPPGSLDVASAGLSNKLAHLQPSIRPSERSAGGVSFRYLLNDKLRLKTVAVQKPFRNLAELSIRLERRGAADENLWVWCENIIKQAKSTKKIKNKDLETQEPGDGFLKLGNLHFPCPLMKLNIEVPLKAPLCKDPAVVKSTRPKRNISNAPVMNIPKQIKVKRYSLWTKDFSKLYPVFKIPSHQYPI